MFNKGFFSDVLTKIYQTYNNQRDFADAAGVNRAYLSQYMNKKLESPPTPKILERIANASKGIVSYRELMSICGYIDLPYSAGFEFASPNDQFCIKKAIDYAILNDIPQNEIQNNANITSILKDIQSIPLDIALDITLKEIFKERVIIGRNISHSSSEEDTPEIRAIARDVAKLKPEKRELFKNLLKQMSDEADEAGKR